MKPIEKLIDLETKWVDIPAPTERPDDDTPYAVREGKFTIAGAELHVIQLNDGRRIITEESLKKFLSILEGASSPPERTTK